MFRPRCKAAAGAALGRQRKCGYHPAIRTKLPGFCTTVQAQRARRSDGIVLLHRPAQQLPPHVAPSSAALQPLKPASAAAPPLLVLPTTAGSTPPLLFGLLKLASACPRQLRSCQPVQCPSGVGIAPGAASSGWSPAGQRQRAAAR